MNDHKKVILSTPRMNLREMTAADVLQTAGILSDPKVMKYYPETLDNRGVTQWIKKNLDRYKSHGYGVWAAQLKTGGPVMGQIGLVPMILEGKEEIAVVYLLRKDYQGKGYATEGAVACRDHAINVLDKPRVISTIRPENKPSVKVILRAGFTPEGTCRLAGFLHRIYTWGPFS